MARKVTYDQEKVKLLRAVLIEDSLAVFNDDPKVKKWSQYRKDLLMKYATRVLPTLNAGKDDDSNLIPQPLLVRFLEEDDGNSHTDTEGV